MRRRNNPVSIWLTDKEYTHLQNQAAIAGRKIDPFIRELIRGSELKERPSEMWVELLRHLAAIGNNINQIAKATNSGQVIGADELLQIQQMQSEIWQKVKSL